MVCRIRFVGTRKRVTILTKMYEAHGHITKKGKIQFHSQNTVNVFKFQNYKHSLQKKKISLSHLLSAGSLPQLTNEQNWAGLKLGHRTFFQESYMDAGT